jgi:hypothetical protein
MNGLGCFKITSATSGLITVSGGLSPLFIASRIAVPRARATTRAP